jgi:GDP/UDP-N,N'-diacetylbacillosamine 2-epimerase (hydrolysing)
MRKVCYISGTRADFGLMLKTLHAIASHPALSLSVVVTGMHLSQAHGHTVDEIRAAALPVLAEVPVQLDPANGATMARNLGTMIGAFVSALEADRPDLLLLLGDRGEMLAGALAAIHLNIPIAHVHGGERSGTVDEPVRHAISKLSHIHLTATDDARERLIRMGETAVNVHAVGAPGLDGLADEPRATRSQLAGLYGFDPANPMALMVYHPVLQEAETGGTDARQILSSLSHNKVQTIVLMPNSDAGSAQVRAVIDAARSTVNLSVQTHLARSDFLDAMAVCDLMIGNSSAGIIEAASFGTPVINIGRRQNLRERNGNVLDVMAADEGLTDCIAQTLKKGRFPCENVYGDGQTADRIAALLAHYDLGADLLMKVNSY